MIGRLASLWRDARGAVVIETAFVAPVLVLMGLGSFQLSQAYSRQHELQTGADDAATLALAGWKTSANTTASIKEILKKTLSLTDSQVTITTKYRCGTDTAYVADKANCVAGAIVTTYLDIALTDVYTPMWVDFGMGEPLTYNVNRTVLVS